MRLSYAALSALSLFALACSEDTADPAPVESQTFPACAADFTLIDPVADRAWTPNAIQLTAEELSPGVFAVYDANAATYGPGGFPSATSGGFVIGTDGVLLVETMINRQLFCQFIDLVRAQTDKPILYAVNTSHHGDHSYGNHFLPDDVQVVQHAETAAFITNPESFAHDVAFMEANFGDDQGLDEIEAVAADVRVGADGWRIDLGGVTVEANDHGFGQTEGDLFVYVPQADVLWTGNPLVARQPALPWLLDGKATEVRETLAEIRQLYPTATVVPGHDAPVAIDSLDFSIAYLDALIAAVGAQIAAGASVEETVAAVTLEDYQGYALWGWVHSVINVPMTYADLSE